MISSTRVAASLLCLRQRATTTTTTTTTTANYVPSSSSSRLALSSSSSSSPLAGDAGRKATHIHHRITTLLSLSVPAYLLVPPSAMCSESCPPPAFASSVSSPRCPCEYHYRNFNAASVVADETFGAKHFTKPYCRTTVQVTQVQGREWRDTLVGRRGVNGGVGDTGG